MVGRSPGSGLSAQDGYSIRRSATSRRSGRTRATRDSSRTRSSGPREGWPSRPAASHGSSTATSVGGGDRLEVHGNDMRRGHELRGILLVGSAQMRPHLVGGLCEFNAHSGKLDRKLKARLRGFGLQRRKPDIGHFEALKNLILRNELYSYKRYIINIY